MSNALIPMELPAKLTSKVVLSSGNSVTEGDVQLLRGRVGEVSLAARRVYEECLALGFGFLELKRKCEFEGIGFQRLVEEKVLDEGSVTYKHVQKWMRASRLVLDGKDQGKLPGNEKSTGEEEVTQVTADPFVVFSRWVREAVDFGPIDEFVESIPYQAAGLKELRRVAEGKHEVLGQVIRELDERIARVDAGEAAATAAEAETRTQKLIENLETRKAEAERDPMKDLGLSEKGE